MPEHLTHEFRGTIEMIARGERVKALETVRRRKDGSTFPAALTLSPITTAEGKIIGASALVRDISERRAAEQALQHAHRVEQALRAELEEVTRASAAVSDAVADLPRTSLAAVLNTLASRAQLLASADYVALGIGTNPEQPFDTWVFVGMSEAEARAIGRNPRPVGLLARADHAIRIRDVREHPAFGGLPSGHPEMGAFLALPISYRNRQVGNLYLARRPGEAEFSEQDEHAVQMLAVRAGSAIETATLYVDQALQRAWLQSTITQMPEPVSGARSRWRHRFAKPARAGARVHHRSLGSIRQAVAARHSLPLRRSRAGSRTAALSRIALG